MTCVLSFYNSGGRHQLIIEGRLGLNDSICFLKYLGSLALGNTSFVWEGILIQQGIWFRVGNRKSILIFLRTHPMVT